jgi:predicted GH43/DUF377 family glycosyl hydrolase
VTVYRANGCENCVLIAPPGWAIAGEAAMMATNKAANRAGFATVNSPLSVCVKIVSSLNGCRATRKQNPGASDRAGKIKQSDELLGRSPLVVPNEPKLGETKPNMVGMAASARSHLPLEPSGVWPLRFDETSLWPGLAGRRFNPSILPDGEGYLFACRDQWWGSDIFIGRLDAEFRPIGAARKLEMAHADADVSREDPRLFRYRGRPHVSFTGTSRGNITPTHDQLYARLSAEGTSVEELFAPHYPARQRWEKNWSFFEHADELFAIYSVVPCRIFRIDGNAAALVFETPTGSDWPGGEIRGGAAPVRVGDELWCFAHDRVRCGPSWTYRTLLVTLGALPPFAVRRMVTAPILVADLTTKPGGQYASVVFAGGAVRLGDDWIVAHGIHDHWCELHRFAHADLEARLVDVKGPRQLTGG